MAIKPPSEFRRSPRSLDTMKFWKASELRAWLLFYSLPVLCKFLPAEYLHHWLLFVFSIHILLGCNIQRKALHVVKSLYHLIPELYGTQSCTANLHSIVHLTHCVEVWGPLWMHSLFGYENMNGHVRKLFHGT